MKFKITSERVFWWPVKVESPNPDLKMAGKMIEQEFKMKFVALPRAEFKDIQAEQVNMTMQERIEHEHDLIMRVCLDWDDNVVDEDGNAVGFSKEVLSDLMSDTYFRIGLYTAFSKAMSGEAARSKN
jgi:hypothetical protein